MDKFKDACSQSCQDWADSFDDTQEYQFSSAFESEMAKLPDEIETQKHRRPSKKTIAFMVNAAVVLCFCAAVLIIPATREQVVGIFKDYIPDSGISSGEDTTIWSDDKDYGAETDSDNSYNNWDGAIEFEFGSEDIGSINDGSSQTGSASYEIPELELGYIPDGFSCGNSTGITKAYINGDRHFEIFKLLCKQVKRNQDNDAVIIGDIEYYVYEKDSNVRVIWNKGDYVYLLTGNLSRDEMLKIASNAE